MEEFITIEENVEAEITEKKSKFIANLFYIENVEEAEKIIKEIKKKYFDAKHNCIAYRVIEKNQIIEKSSDDGEPSGTAGQPMLSILQKNKLANVLIIVTRYFGGILLGTGGLVRAYSSSVTNALKDDNIIPYKKIIKKRIVFSYNDIKNVDYILKDYNITYKEYDDNVIYEFECEENNYPDKLDSYVIKKDDV